LPSEVGSGCARNRVAKQVVPDPIQRTCDVGWNHSLGRHEAYGASFGRAFDRGQVPDPKTERAYTDAKFLKAVAHVVGQERQFMRPNRAWNSEHERVQVERHGLGVLGDPCPDRVAPQPRGDWSMDARESAFACAT
jgi:hypothetical protein